MKIQAIINKGEFESEFTTAINPGIEAIWGRGVNSQTLKALSFDKRRFTREMVEKWFVGRRYEVLEYIEVPDPEDVDEHVEKVKAEVVKASKRQPVVRSGKGKAKNAVPK